MKLRVAEKVADLIGNTPILKVRSLSQLTGCEIFLKCESFNPGGSIKDRAALQMVLDGLESGKLKPGMTIVEGTAGNTGIGLALVAKSFGLNMLAVCPSDQTQEKLRMLGLFGAELKLMSPVPFKDQKHFYHTARRIAEEDPDKYWWANQFENLSNFKAHYQHTAPEIAGQLAGKIDYFVSVAGTGGTIAGNSTYLKEKIPGIKVILADPDGSGLFSYFKTGEFKSHGSSFTEGIGIMRLVENFKQAKIDDAINLPDQDVYSVAQYVRKHDGIILGSSSALNVAAALHTAVKSGSGKRIVTFLCDLGERSFSKLYNQEYLKERDIDLSQQDAKILIDKYAKA